MSRKVIVRRKRNPSTRQMDCRLHRPRMGRSRKLLARRTRLARSQLWNLVDCRRSGEDVSILQAPSRQQDYRRGLGYDDIGVSVSRATETVTSDFGKVEFLRNGPVLLVKATLHVDSAAVKSTWTDICSVPRWAKVTSCWGTVKDFSGQDAGIWDIVDGKLKIYLNKVGGNDFNANGLMMLL